MQRHVDIYRHKVINKKSLMSHESVDEEEKLNLEIPIDDPNQIVLHKEMMLESTSNSWEVRVETENIDFNFCDYGRTSEYWEIVIRNDYPFSVKIHWITNETMNSLGQMVSNPFIFKDQDFEIPAHSSYTSQVKFKPYEPNFYFF